MALQGKHFGTVQGLCHVEVIGVPKGCFFFSHGETGALVKDISAWQKHILKVPMSEEI